MGYQPHKPFLPGTIVKPDICPFPESGLTKVQVSIIGQIVGLNLGYPGIPSMICRSRDLCSGRRVMW